MRTMIELDGLWEFRPANELAGQAAPAAPAREPYEDTPIRVPGYWRTFPPDTGGDWGAYDHYNYPAHWAKADAAWYRRRFDAADVAADGDARWRLRFDAVAGATTVWLNGQQLGTNVDSFLPFDFDVTDALQSTGNELVLLVQPPPQKDGLWQQPCGSWVGWHMRGVWQSVTLEQHPATWIDAVFVQPSVRAARIAIDVELQAMGDASDLSVVVKIVDGEQTVLSLSDDAINLAAGKPHTLQLGQAWGDPVLWSPENPHLYQAVVELRRGGEIIDTLKTRFGFREFWIDGLGFVLNGKPVKLFGDSWHYMGPVQQNPAYARCWFEFAKQVGVNAIRTHAMPYPPLYFELADEMGMLIIDESAVYGSAGTLAFDETFWERSRDHMRRLVRRDRNHPSIIFWSACNETVWRGGERIFPGLKSLAEAAKAEDPTRFVSFDENDCTVGDAAPLHAGHYGTPTHWDNAWNRERPLVVHEFSTLYHGGPDAICHIGDDVVFADYFARLQAAGEDAADMFMRLRQIGAVSLTPWNLNWYCLTPWPKASVEPIPEELTAGGAPLTRIGARAVTFNYGFMPDEPKWSPNPALAPLARCYRRRRLFITKRPGQGFAKGNTLLELDVFNDEAEALSGSVRVTITADGAEETLVERTLDITPMTRITLTEQVAFPAVSESVTAMLTAELRVEDAVIDEEQWDVRLAPRATGAASTARSVWVAGALSAAGLQKRVAGSVAFDQLDTVLEDANRTLVLAPPHAGRTLHDWLTAPGVSEWLARGGRLVALPGGTAEDPQSLLAPLPRTEPRVFVRDSARIFEDLTNDDLRDWGADGFVTEQVFERPTVGPACTPLDVGDPAAGIAYTPLVIVPQDRGHVVVSGLALDARADDTPAAAAVAERLFSDPLDDYAGRGMRLLGDESFRQADLFNVIGCPDGRDGADLWLVDGSSREALTDARLSEARVNDHLDHGGVLWIDQLGPDTLADWNRRLNLSLQIFSETVYNVAIPRRHDLLAGVNNFDLCWVDRDAKEPIVEHLIEAETGERLIETVATRWEDYQTTHEQHKVALMYRRIEQFERPRAALLAIRRGDGWILINQLRLRQARGIFARRAQRVASRLLDALGAERQPGVSVLQRRPAASVRPDGYITRWLVLGPFAGGAHHPLDEPYVDEADLDVAPSARVADRTWEVAHSAFAGVDVAAMFEELPAKDRVAYAATYVYSAMDRSVLLDAPDMLALLDGADGGVKVFLNDQELGRYDFVRELVPDTDRTENVPLKRGWNKLVLKLHNPSGKWRFCARFMTAAGQPVNDFPCQLELPRE